MYSSKSLLASLLLAAPVAFVSAADDCDCYLTNGPQPTYFSGHMFFDLRSLSQYKGIPDSLKSVEANANADFTSPYFNYESEWGQTWGLQKWNNGNKTFPMQNSFNNIYIEENADETPESDTYMTMRTSRMPGFQSAAEFESLVKYQYVSMRMYSRSFGSPGACTSMFTYLGADKLADVQEADIEILTNDAHNIIHYTNQPSYTDEGEEVEGATEAPELPNGADWTNWNVHRMDWTPEKTVWFVNGAEAASIALQVPKDPAQLTFNVWSNGLDWTGLMPETGEAYQQIQWIEILHGLADKNSCKKVCKIDETKEVGVPEPVTKKRCTA